MTGEYEEKKAAYENLAAGLESNMSKLEQVIIPTHPSLHSDRLSFFHAYINVRAAVIFARKRSAFLAKLQLSLGHKEKSERTVKQTMRATALERIFDAPYLIH